MPSVVAPNMPGFIEAQANLRTRMGAPVTFKVPVTKTWPGGTKINPDTGLRSEEHTSELQSRSDLVCRLLLEKKKQDADRAKHAHHATADNSSRTPLQSWPLPLPERGVSHPAAGAPCRTGHKGPHGGDAHLLP